jgi:hypothetical protein
MRMADLLALSWACACSLKSSARLASMVLQALDRHYTWSSSARCRTPHRLVWATKIAHH